MNSDSAIILALVILVGAATVVWSPQTMDITGNVVAALGAGILPPQVIADTAAATGTAVTNGPPTQASIPIAYNGAGIATITVRKPSGFTGGSSWMLIENGVTKTVEDLGTTLRWSADLSQKQASLICTIPAPTLIIESVSESATTFEEKVRVDADYHISNVIAHVPVSRLFTAYKLEEFVDGTWVARTEEYKFVVEDTIATWSGFGLSTRTFRLSSSQVDALAVANIRATPTPPPQAQSSTNTIVVQGHLELALVEGQASEFNVTISSSSQNATNLSVRAPTFLAVPSSILVPANATTSLTVTTLPLSPGNWSGTIELTDGVQTYSVALKILVHPAPPKPVVEQPNVVTSKNSSEENVVPLAVIMVLAIIIAATYIGYIGRKATSI